MGLKTLLGSCYFAQDQPTDASTTSLDSKRPIPLSPTPSHQEPVRRIPTPPLSQHPAFRNAPDAPDAPVHISAPTNKSSQPMPPELARPARANAHTRNLLGDSLRIPAPSARLLFDQGAPFATVGPAGHKLVVSRSGEVLRGERKWAEASVNGRRKKLLSIREVVEGGGKLGVVVR